MQIFIQPCSIINLYILVIVVFNFCQINHKYRSTIIPPTLMALVLGGFGPLWLFIKDNLLRLRLII